MGQQWLTAYFSGASAPLPPLAASRTPFQSRLRTALLGIPPGVTRTYGELSALLDTSPRALGQGVGANPMALIVPCHRVVAANGGLGGFACGLEWKRRLLGYEAQGGRWIDRSTGDKPCSRASERNGPHILAELRSRLPGAGRLLEIGSGSGQHAVMFARELTGITWQTSDLADKHAGMNLWLQEAGLDNLLPPLTLDVTKPQDWLNEGLGSPFDAVFTANTLHIMPGTAVEALFARIASLMRPGAQLFIYGPFMVEGEHVSDSNREFDAFLRQRDPLSGVRDTAWLQGLACVGGLELSESIVMPSNNRLLVWRRAG